MKEFYCRLTFQLKDFYMKKLDSAIISFEVKETNRENCHGGWTDTRTISDLLHSDYKNSKVDQLSLRSCSDAKQHRKSNSNYSASIRGQVGLWI